MLQVERVLPSLKITVRQDAKDWRAHLEQMETYRTNLNETLAQVKPQLSRHSGAPNGDGRAMTAEGKAPSEIGRDSTTFILR